MLFSVTRIHFNVILLVCLGISNGADFSQQCYVCGSNTNISCDNFDPTNKLYIQYCPSAGGCSAVLKHGNFDEMSCEQGKFRGYHKVNGVDYYYCTASLCNGKVDGFSDDEDLPDEGSGTTVISNTIHNEQKIFNTTNQSTHVRFYSYSIYIPILAILRN